jgi:Porin PorA
MRRIVGLVLVALGVALIALAVALPSYVYPRVAKVPVNPDQNIVAEGTGITTLVPALVVKGGNGILLNQKVVSTRRVVGQVPPDGKVLPEGQAFYRVAFDANVDNPKLSKKERLMQAYVEGGSFDGTTGEATNCCGDYLITDPTDPKGDPITHEGVIFKFPFNLEQGKDYPFWDVNIKAAVPARYDGTEKIDGLTTYRYVQNITDEVIGEQDVPGALVGQPEQPSVTAERVYATVRTLWVEPYTGALIKGAEKVNQRLVADGKQVPVIVGSLAFTDETVKANVKAYKSSAAGLAFVTKTGPLGGWILGPIFVLIGLTVLALSRREQDDYYDDDEWDDDDYDDDADDDAGHRSSSSNV